LTIVSFGNVQSPESDLDVTDRVIAASTIYSLEKRDFAHTETTFMKSIFGTVISATLLVFCFSGSSREGLKLFHKMQKALGGADKIAAIRDFEELARAESWNGNTGQSLGEVRKRTRIIRPNHLRIDQDGPGSTYVLYFDGATGWEILPGARQVVELKGGELEFARGMLRGHRLNTWIADRDPRYSITSPAPNFIRVSDGDITHQLDITVDTKSWLPVKLGFTTLSDPAHPVTGEDVLAEWETVQGIRFPRRFTVFRRGVRVAEAKEIRSFINSGLKPADLAAKPSDLKPVLSPRQETK
jgi:hypothetical protein